MAGWRVNYIGLLGLLRRQREEKKISQPKIAKALRTSRRTFQRWENGEADPSASNLFEWASLLEIEIAPNLAQLGKQVMRQLYSNTSQLGPVGPLAKVGSTGSILGARPQTKNPQREV